jgi:ribosomal protein S18 acetylase RimI-like enzyme
MIIRGAHGDVPFMRSMLAHAYGWRVSAFDVEIPLARYVENWGRTGDVALIATEGRNRVGAAWFRVFSAAAPGYAFVDEGTPELTIAVVPSRRQHGVGAELLAELLKRAAAEGHEAISLSVEKGSPAIGFYERHGFERIGETEHAVSMRRAL